MNRRLGFNRRRVQPRLKLVAALLSTALALAVAPAIASALSTAGRGGTARARSTATGANPRFTAPLAPRLSLAPPAVASRSRWSIQPSPNPTAPNGQLKFGTCTSPSSCVGVGTYVTASKVGVTLVERWDGAKWSVQPTPNPAGAKVSVLNGVACSAPSACTAVGGAVSASGKGTTLVERWNGRRWRIEPTPNPAGSRQSVLFGVACPLRSTCLAVGASYPFTPNSKVIVERWNGSTWRLQHAPSPAGALLIDVSCTAPSTCTAVGFSSGGTLAERYNGRNWDIQPTPNPSQGGGGLNGVMCTSPSSCTAVGGSFAGTLAERWNGHQWRIQRTPNPSGGQGAVLNGVDCSSRSACTGVGGYGNASGTFLTLAERWDGHRWTIQRTPSPSPVQGSLFYGVFCPSSSACTAFGLSRFSNGSGTPLTLAQRWNGHSWRLQRTPNPGRARGGALLGLSCTSSSSCQAVGQTTAGTLAERWNGTTWAIELTPSPAGAAASALNGVSCTSPSACIAVGAALTTFSNGSPVGTLAERWNGHSWRIQPTPISNNPAALNAVSCTSASACTAVGGTPSQLLAERWNGTSWTTQHVPVPAGVHGGFLTGVSCTSAASCSAVGIAGFDSSGNPTGTIAERWNGRKWSIQPTPTANSTGDAFNAVSCTSPSACAAVGGTASKLLAERWNGTSWTIQATPKATCTQRVQGASFNGVSCTSRSTCTAVALGSPPSGPFLLAEHWNGTKWSIQPTPNLPGVYDMAPPAVSCPSSSTCTAVGGYTNNGVQLTLAERWHGSNASEGLP